MAGFYPNVWVLIYSGQYFLFSCCGPVFSIGFPISWCLKLMKRYEYYAHSTVLIMKSTYICHYILKCKYVLPIKYLEVFSVAFLQSRIFFKSENFFMIMMVCTQNNFDQNNMSHCFYLDIAEEKKKNRQVVVQSLSHVWLSDPMNCSTPSFPVLHYLPEFAQTLLSQWYHPIILILCRPFLLMPSIFPSIRVFCTFIYFKKTLRKPKLFTTKKFQLFEYQ